MVSDLPLPPMLARSSGVRGRVRLFFRVASSLVDKFGSELQPAQNTAAVRTRMETRTIMRGYGTSGEAYHR